MSRFIPVLLFGIGLSTACCLGYFVGMFAPRMALLPLETIALMLLIFSFFFNREDEKPPLFTPVAAVTCAAWAAEADRFNMPIFGDIVTVMLPIWFIMAVIFFARYKTLTSNKGASR